LIFSTMRKPFTLIVAFLLIALLFVAMSAGCASAKDIVTISLDKRFEVTPGIIVHLIQLTISDTTYGASFAQDESKVVYPVLVYNYENHGTVPATGHLHARFVDDQGTIYDGVDAGEIGQIPPGGTSSTWIIEVNIPKDRKITEITFVRGLEPETTYTITYPATPTPSPVPTATPAASAARKGNFCISTVLLPLLLVGAAWLGGRAIKR
jgi:hypothetical protein